MKAVYLLFSIFFWVIHHDYVSSRLLKTPTADILGRMTEEFNQREGGERASEIDQAIKASMEPQKKKLENEGRFISKVREFELPKLKATAEKSKRTDTHFYIPRELDGVFEKFITYKLSYGYPNEKTYYGRFKSNIGAFKASLILKRARVFTNKEDLTLLRKEHSDVMSYLPWDLIGVPKWEVPSTQSRMDIFKDWMNKYDNTAHAKKWRMLEEVKAKDLEQFNLENYMSYDEMELAALMIVAGPTNFYSNCQVLYMNRKYGDEDHVQDGYIVGAIGPRFDKPGYMDWKQMVGSGSSSSQLRADIYGSRFRLLPAANTAAAKTEYLRMPWFDFFKNTWGAWKEEHEIADIKEPWFAYFGSEKKMDKGKEIKVPVVPVHRELFKQRLKITYGAYLDFVHQTILKQKIPKKAYVMILPLGGGAWSINGPVQKKQMWPVIENLIAERGYKDTIDTIHFVGFSPQDEVPTETVHDGIKIFTDPMDLTGKRTYDTIVKTDGKEEIVKRAREVNWEDTVRFTMYPWDSNALPGNEFFMPSASNWPAYSDQGFQMPSLISLLQMSGDPAAACCSDITEIQNSHQNQQLSDKESIQQLRYRAGDVVCLPDHPTPEGAIVQRDEDVGMLSFLRIMRGEEQPVQTCSKSDIVPCPKSVIEIVNSKKKQLQSRRHLMTANAKDDALNATALLSFVVAIAVLLISSIYMVFIYE